MKRISSTLPSTAETDSFVDTLPSPYKEAIQGHFDALQRHRDALAAVRAARTENIEAGIVECYLHHRRYFEQYLFRQHAQKLRDKLEHEYRFFDLADPPSLRVIRRTLRERYSTPPPDVLSECD